MKNYRLALMFLACSAATSAFAQNSLPPCESANYDAAKGVFTAMNPTRDAVNQQCLLTIHPKSAAANLPRNSFVEGNYAIDLSGGGGGGGGGAVSKGGQAGGGGGASAAPSRTVQYLSPGVYKLTMGTGGEGGRSSGGRTESGNPTNITNANTGQLIAGFPGADVARQGSRAAQSEGTGVGRGGVAESGGRSGASGSAEAGGSGGSASGMSGLGAGGSGGSGGKDTAQAGGTGGAGYIKLALQDRAPVAQAPAPTVSAPTAAQGAYTPPAEPKARPAKRDRN